MQIRVRLLAFALFSILLAGGTGPSALAAPRALLGLSPCGPGVVCGALRRPLDPNGRIPGDVGIHFRLYAATGGPATGTIVTVEGGPGYASIGSLSGYLALFAPLRATHDVLIVDNRGTGLSDAIVCRPLQTEIERTPQALGECARQLEASAYLYGTAEAADDLAAIVTALGLGKVDLYGDSYGTFFGQAFAVRHPEMVRTLILDSAYPVIGEDPWYPHQAPTARYAFNIACARTPACAALGGTSMERIDRLVAMLRAQPFSGIAPDGDGTLRKVTASAPTLFALMIAESNAPTIYRELDAAARADFGGDPLPLLRLLAEARLSDPENSDHTGPTEFSEGLFVADQCGDYPQLYDLRADTKTRYAQLAAAVRLEGATHPDVYAPFTIAESQMSPYNDNAIALCANWARPDSLEQLAQPIPKNAAFPKLPVLVLNGELDTVTTAAEGREAAALFPESTWLDVPNSIHETAVSDGGNYISPGGDLTGCVSAIVLHFVRAKRPGDTSCLASIRPVRGVPRFPVVASDVAPAVPSPGNAANPAQLRIVAATVATAGDVLNRYWANYSGSGAGLRGGTFGISSFPPGYAFKLDGIAYARDLTVSGYMKWDQVAGVVSGTFKFAGESSTGRISVAWNERESGAIAAIAGSIDGKPVAAACPAP